jgi:hypothetical protein
MRLSEPRFQPVAQGVRRLQNRCAANCATVATCLSRITHAVSDTRSAGARRVQAPGKVRPGNEALRGFRRDFPVDIRWSTGDSPR